MIVKLTEGSNYTNPYAITQMKQAAQAGLNVNIYHYADFSNSTQATDEANYLLKTLRDNGVDTKIKIFADMESSATQNDNVAANLNTFWKVLKNGGYNDHGVYTYTNYLYRSAVINTVGKAKHGSHNIHINRQQIICCILNLVHGNSHKLPRSLVEIT